MIHIYLHNSHFNLLCKHGISNEQRTGERFRVACLTKIQSTERADENLW